MLTTQTSPDGKFGRNWPAIEKKEKSGFVYISIAQHL
jgi:hypothetical protein